jgi:uncharacterized membrane protein
MHTFGIITVFFVFTLVGVEFSVSAFFNPAAWQLDSDTQRALLGRLALVLGKVMPVWYPACGLVLVLQTWFHWHTPGIDALLAADVIWLFTSVLTIFFLVPLNNRVAKGAPDWQKAHRAWDKRHRIRIVALALAAVLLADVLLG